jgi:riboflavin biosynthesis pyrimidine reductase
MFQLPDDPLLQLPALFTELAKRQINQVLVEAGPRLAGALLQQGLLDEIVLYQAPMFLGDAARDAFAGIRLDALESQVAQSAVDKHESSSSAERVRTPMNSAFRFQVIEQRRIGNDTRLILQPSATHNTINS